ncbi:MAG: DMT family transporter [Candidatus Aphodosoma sp.]
MGNKVKGIFFGIVAAVCYGTNPLGALYLYADGVNVNTVIFFRYLIAVSGLLLIILLKREPFGIRWRELGVVAVLGVLFGASSLTLFGSFLYMEAGIASALLFVYPVMVAVIMALFFGERITWRTVLSILLALVGIAMLYRGDGGAVLSMTGVILVMVSSLTYAVYIVIVNQAKLDMSSVKLTFYVLVFALVTVAAYSFAGDVSGRIVMLHGTLQWGYAAMLGVVPTLVSLVTMAIAIRMVGSTPAAIMGALEPVTAVAIGVFVFGERFTLRLMIGIALILAAVILIVSGTADKRINNKQPNIQ